MSALLELAARVEAAPVNRKDRTLNREVALAVGWARLTPSESRKSYPTWYHPSDVRDGRPVFDSLHGTEVWREPSNYLGSLDDAMSLVPKGCGFNLDRYWINNVRNDGLRWSCHLSFGGLPGNPRRVIEVFDCFTAPLAIVAAALRAKAVGEGV